jgi:hypothetical protein
MKIQFITATAAKQMIVNGNAAILMLSVNAARRLFILLKISLY